MWLRERRPATARATGRSGSCEAEAEAEFERFARATVLQAESASGSVAVVSFSSLPPGIMTALLFLWQTEHSAKCTPHRNRPHLSAAHERTYCVGPIMGKRMRRRPRTLCSRCCSCVLAADPSASTRVTRVVDKAGLPSGKDLDRDRWISGGEAHCWFQHERRQAEFR